MLNICTSKKELGLCINIILVIVLLLSILLLILICRDMTNTSFYVPFALSVSVSIAILTIKVNMRDKMIEHHFVTTNNAVTQLHATISNINILMTMVKHIRVVFDGSSGTTKHLLMYVQKLYDDMLSNLYSKEVIALLEPKAVRLLEEIIQDSIFLQVPMAKYTESLDPAYAGKIVMENTDNAIVTICNGLIDNLVELQEIVTTTANNKTKAYRQIAEEENV